MQKNQVPPSGDKHDYMSVGPYWWPDPNKPDGLPYIRRDGEVNPEYRSEDLDKVAYGQLNDSVTTLALAYYLSDRHEFAEHAARLLRAWFLDEATKMNPNLEFGQAIPGRVTGRGIGIIETRSLIGVVNAVELITPSNAWTDADQTGMVDWCVAYLHWLRNSSHGKDENKTSNNHAGLQWKRHRQSFARVSLNKLVACLPLTQWCQHGLSNHVAERCHFHGIERPQKANNRSVDHTADSASGRLILGAPPRLAGWHPPVEIEHAELTGGCRFFGRVNRRMTPELRRVTNVTSLAHEVSRWPKGTGPDSRFSPSGDR